MDLGYMNVVYFDLQMGALQAVSWLKSSFWAFNTFFCHKCTIFCNLSSCCVFDVHHPCRAQLARRLKPKSHSWQTIGHGTSGYCYNAFKAPVCWSKYTTDGCKNSPRIAYNSIKWKNKLPFFNDSCMLSLRSLLF